jgi:hypothetical protein
MLTAFSYTTDKNDKEESQKHLDQWTNEEWQTKEGSGNAKGEDGIEKRYLPKKAWEKMSEEEKVATDKKKQAAGKEGKQYAENTNAAKQARKQAGEERDEAENEHERENEEDNEEENKEKNCDTTEGAKGEGSDEAAEHEEVGSVTSDNSSSGESNESDREGHESKIGSKRRRVDQADTHGSTKKQKKNSSKSGKATVGSKHDKAEPPAQQASKDRLPKKGDKVVWKALPGYVDGDVVEVVYEEKNVEGKRVKGSKDDPRLVLKSASSGKICVHKPEAVYFD